jgi:DNA-binding CsgD family transcriptional regulator
VRDSPACTTELAEHRADDALTERELDVLKSVAAGNSNKIVADKLAISEEIGKSHERSILSKPLAETAARIEIPSSVVGDRNGYHEFIGRARRHRTGGTEPALTYDPKRFNPCIGESSVGRVSMASPFHRRPDKGSIANCARSLAPTLLQCRSSRAENRVREIVDQGSCLRSASS